jgi:heparan-alpha-glucosaminide N-acetyltransferase
MPIQQRPSHDSDCRTDKFSGESSARFFSERIVSIDALRGLVMFTMIFVNDLAGAPERIVPRWMRHFHGKSGMTFVDLVFPAFLFIVGMSIPFALGARLAKGEPVWKIVIHILTRTMGLLIVGIMMVNESPDSAVMGWSGALWSVLMFLSSILAFSTLAPFRAVDREANIITVWRYISLGLRIIGYTGLALLAFAFRSADGHRIISISPFSIHTEWYGILGLIGWAYLVASMAFLLFRGHRTSLLGAAVLLLCLYPADRTGAFQNFWLAHYVGIGETLGSQASITVAGLLLGSILLAPDMTTVRSRTTFTIMFIAGFAVGALLLQGLYGINKNSATPSWCLWACSITAALWFLFYYGCDVRSKGVGAKIFAVAGQNVLLAYLLSELLPPALDLLKLDAWYGGMAQHNLASTIARSVGCAVIILSATATLNLLGFRLKL